MIDIQPYEEGAILPVRAQAGAAKNGLGGIHDRMLKVAVTQIAERGKANKAIIALLAKQLGVAKSRIQLLSGETSAKKRLLVQGVTPRGLRERIEDSLKGS